MAKGISSFTNLLNKNEEDSYLAYVSKNGIRKTENYYDALAEADTARTLSSTDYGARADKLASSGLNSSGFEDYLRSRVDGEYVERSNRAERGMYKDEYANQKGYLAYLSDYEKLQTSISESVIKDIASKRNFSYEDALNEAVRAGISKDLAYVTASKAVKQAKENAYNQALSFAKLNKLSPSKAKAYALSLGLDERYAERVYEEISTLSKEQKEFFSQMTTNEFYEYIKSKNK